MRSHTGGVISFGTGGVVCKSSKQKLNTKSSTEAELIGASDYLPNSIWVKFFMEAQGHQILESWFEQDNQSTIRLELNGCSSCGPKLRHIDIRYFFIKDRTTDTIKIQHCPTLEMLADFFTKPLQGALFCKFRDVILGYKHVDTLSDLLDTAAQEHVGERPTDATSTARDLKKDTPEGKKVSWASVVVGGATKKSKPPQPIILSKQSS